MSLREALQATKEKFKGMAPPEAMAQMARATEELRASGIQKRVLKVGQKAPEFRLGNTSGVEVGSQELLSKAPLVVTFYRGKW